VSVFVASENREEDFARPNPRNVLANATPSSLGTEDWTLVGGGCGQWNMNWMMVACIPNSTWKGRVVLVVVLAGEKRGPGQSELNIGVSRSSNWNENR